MKKKLTILTRDLFHPKTTPSGPTPTTKQPDTTRSSAPFITQEEAQSTHNRHKLPSLQFQAALTPKTNPTQNLQPKKGIGIKPRYLQSSNYHYIPI